MRSKFDHMVILIPKFTSTPGIVTLIFHNPLDPVRILYSFSNF